MTVEKRIGALEIRVLGLERAMVRVARLLAIIQGISPEEIDQMIIEEDTRVMREKGEL
jgi:hypothetical protein